ncbi:DUF4097 family beta strand repeat-containing protein [Paenibacillus sp. SGZ-1009]|uniref:DUF4097 family beta strand repeat-containing protein n=1 Tax=Paenibacillus campi TaxID=3106031 RepID=UPI002AFECE79|nr:DUF4097 family beta strand repeat-containing protein [Paenibacillus sp. SGZ-1009]
MNKWLWSGFVGAVVLGLAAFSINSLQLGNPPANKPYEQQWKLAAGTMKQLYIQSDYEIAVQFAQSTDGDDHVIIEGAVTPGIGQQLKSTILQTDTLALHLDRQQHSWQLVKPRVQPHVQYITIQLADLHSLQLADFRLGSAQTNLNHIQAAHIRVQSGSGRIKAQQLQGNVQLITSNGDISVATWAGTKLDMQTGSGQIQIGKASGTIHTATGSGELHIQQLRGNADINSHSGDVQLALAGSHNVNVQVETAAVNIVTEPTFAGSYKADSQFGHVLMPKQSLTGPYQIHTYSESGSIAIRQTEL